MTSTFVSPPALTALLAFTSPARGAATARDGRSRSGRPTDGHGRRPRPKRQPRRAEKQALPSTSWKKGRPITMQYYRPQ